MDQPPLKPGEIRFETSGGQQLPVTQEDSRREKRKNLGILIGAAFFFIVCTVGSIYQDRHQVEVPARPTPPSGIYVRFDVRAPDNDQEVRKTMTVVAFVYEPIVVWRVPPHKIPPDDVDHAVNFSSHSTMPLHLASAESTRPPYILRGNIHIAMGALTGNDIGITRFQLEDGDLTNAYLQTRQGDPRGPPAPPRRIYIEGTIDSVDGPKQLKHSLLDSKILDLGPPRGERAAEDLRKWDDEIKRLSETYKVPADELRKNAGETMKIEAGHLVDVPHPGGDVSGRDRERERERDRARDRVMEPRPRAIR